MTRQSEKHSRRRRAVACAGAAAAVMAGPALAQADEVRALEHPRVVPGEHQLCAPFMNTTRWTGDEGNRQSMLSRRYGVRAVRQRPGSEEARCESTR